MTAPTPAGDTGPGLRHRVVETVAVNLTAAAVFSGVFLAGHSLAVPWLTEQDVLPARVVQLEVAR